MSSALWIVPVLIEKYYRISGESQKAIGVFNEDLKENMAFIQFTKQFSQAGLPVPEVHKYEENETIYLLEDLGDQSLFDLRMEESADSISETVVNYYKKSLSNLLKFQFIGKEKN